MPLLPGKENIGRNMSELAKDNKKKGKARGANGKPRSHDQMVAIAMSEAGMSKKPEHAMAAEAVKNSKKSKKT